MRSSGALAGVIVVTLLLLPLFYVLSVGPAVWVYDRALVGTQLADVCERIYWPLEWTARTVPFVERPLEAYISWFRHTPPAQPLPPPAAMPAPVAPVSPYSVPAQAADETPAVPMPVPSEVPDLSEPAVCR